MLCSVFKFRGWILLHDLFSQIRWRSEMVFLNYHHGIFRNLTYKLLVHPITLSIQLNSWVKEWFQILCGLDWLLSHMTQGWGNYHHDIHQLATGCCRDNGLLADPLFPLISPHFPWTWWSQKQLSAAEARQQGHVPPNRHRSIAFCIKGDF